MSNEYISTYFEILLDRLADRLGDFIILKSKIGDID